MIIAPITHMHQHGSAIEKQSNAAEQDRKHKPENLPQRVLPVCWCIVATADTLGNTRFALTPDDLACPSSKTVEACSKSSCFRRAQQAGRRGRVVAFRDNTTCWCVKIGASPSIRRGSSREGRVTSQDSGSKRKTCHL